MNLARRLLFLFSLVLLASSCRRRHHLEDFGTVPAFTLTDQGGNPVSNESLRGKTWVAAFVFTRCPMACPRVTRAMKNLQKQAATRKLDLRLVSFSVDPENDTPEVLRKYAAEYGADLTSWSFLTGDAGAIRRAAEEGFRIAVEGNIDTNMPDLGLIHGTQLVLVDTRSHIRGYYSSDDPHELERLLEEAAHIAW